MWLQQQPIEPPSSAPTDAIRLDYRTTGEVCLARRYQQRTGATSSPPRSARSSTTNKRLCGRRGRSGDARAAAVRLIYRVIGALSGVVATFAATRRRSTHNLSVALRLLAAAAAILPAGPGQVSGLLTRHRGRRRPQPLQSVFHPINVHYGSPTARSRRGY